MTWEGRRIKVRAKQTQHNKNASTEKKRCF
jgi:hypothetical protein